MKKKTDEKAKINPEVIKALKDNIQRLKEIEL